MAKKKDIVLQVAKTNNIPLREATKWVNATFEATKDVLVEHDTITIQNFGRFELALRKGRRNRTFSKKVDADGKYIEKVSDTIVVKFDSRTIKRMFYIPSEGLTELGEQKCKEFEEKKKLSEKKKSKKENDSDDED